MFVTVARKTQLLVIGLVVLVITSAVSHLVARGLHLRVQAVSTLTFGDRQQPAATVAAGSSLTFYGINWSEIAGATGSRVQGWAVPSGSVVEMETLQAQVTGARRTFLGLGISDLNENYLSDYRAEIVPLFQNLKGLWAAHPDAAFARRVLSQYPLKYLRVLFPTAGRAMHVMVGAREMLRQWRGRRAADEPGERAVISSDANTHQDNITTWPEARRLRNIGLIREGAGGVFAFHGPKREALFRLLQRGAAQGKMVVFVIPESPTYRREFVTPEVQRRFEETLTEARRRIPEALWIRLDAAPELKSDEDYWDLVHLNAAGQAKATKILREQLAAAGAL